MVTWPLWWVFLSVFRDYYQYKIETWVGGTSGDLEWPELSTPACSVSCPSCFTGRVCRFGCMVKSPHAVKSKEWTFVLFSWPFGFWWCFVGCCFFFFPLSDTEQILFAQQMFIALKEMCKMTVCWEGDGTRWLQLKVPCLRTSKTTEFPVWIEKSCSFTPRFPKRCNPRRAGLWDCWPDGFHRVWKLN